MSKISDKRNRCARSAPLRLVLAALGGLLLSGCATQSYMGISLLPGQASPEVQEVARRAQSGDKQAQYDLGTRYENGLGVPNNPLLARKLYRQAAIDSGGIIWVYSPPIGNETNGRVEQINAGPSRSGLRKAKQKILDYEKKKRSK